MNIDRSDAKNQLDIIQNYFKDDSNICYNNKNSRFEVYKNIRTLDKNAESENELFSRISSFLEDNKQMFDYKELVDFEKTIRFRCNKLNEYTDNIFVNYLTKIYDYCDRSGMLLKESRCSLLLNEVNELLDVKIASKKIKEKNDFYEVLTELEDKPDIFHKSDLIKNVMNNLSDAIKHNIVDYNNAVSYLSKHVELSSKLKNKFDDENFDVKINDNSYLGFEFAKQPEKLMNVIEWALHAIEYKYSDETLRLMLDIDKKLHKSPEDPVHFFVDFLDVTAMANQLCEENIKIPDIMIDDINSMIKKVVDNKSLDKKGMDDYLNDLKPLCSVLGLEFKFEKQTEKRIFANEWVFHASDDTAGLIIDVLKRLHEPSKDRVHFFVDFLDVTAIANQLCEEDTEIPDVIINGINSMIKKVIDNKSLDNKGMDDYLNDLKPLCEVLKNSKNGYFLKNDKIR